MADSVYKVIELVGTSSESWEKAAKVAVERAAKSLRDLRVAVQQIPQHTQQLWRRDGKGTARAAPCESARQQYPARREYGARGPAFV